MLRRYVAVVSVFSALAVASNYAMFPLFQVKLMDSLVFIAAYLFGLRVGGSVAAITWLVYGSLNPLGAAGFPLLLILMIGETVYAVSGALLGRIWNRSTSFGGGRRYLNRSLTLGITGLFSAFTYDIWTNAVDGALIYRSMQGVLIRIASGAPFALIHETADFLFFALAVPALIVSIGRVSGLKTQKSIPMEVKTQ
ncbi:MAG: hypothetical protein M1503_09160 [Thaumarchaeota archaeon]|nr:hypothetical protein [Nitrososphaerota archaeon]MCL5318406.1 hypothetical protein [Nitrososphaerota archaeon]